MGASIKFVGGVIVALIATIRCADTSLSSDQRKEAKKDKPGVTSDTSATNTDVNQPQVITGAYLTCVIDTLPDTRSGETGFGCGVYDNSTQNKIDMTGRSLQLTAKSDSGQAIASRMTAAPATSNYNQYLYASTTGKSIRVSGRVLSGNTEIFSATVRTIYIANLTDGFSLKSRYTPQEIGAWCSVVIRLPDQPQDMQSFLSKGTACGSSYLCSHKYAANELTCTVGDVSTIAGTIGSWFGSTNPSTFLGNAGLCTDSSIPNYQMYTAVCNQPVN